jgi:hypothetical protein
MVSLKISNQRLEKDTKRLCVFSGVSLYSGFYKKPLHPVVRDEKNFSLPCKLN